MRHHLRYLTASSWFNRTESRVASGGLTRHTTSASSHKHNLWPAGPRINTRECIRLEDQVLPEHPLSFPVPITHSLLLFARNPSLAIIPTLRLVAHEHLFRRFQRSLVSQANTSRHCQHFHLFNNSLLDLRQLFHYLPLCASMRSNIVIGSFHYSLSLSSALLVGPGLFVHSQTRLRWWGWNDLGNRRHPHETLPLPLLVLPVESRKCTRLLSRSPRYTTNRSVQTHHRGALCSQS
jgi:hypothetical protein